MGYTPKETTGGGSSESRESVSGNRDRIQRDRDRDKSSSSSQATAEATAQAEAQEEAAQKAKAKSEKEARDEAEAGGLGTFGNLTDGMMGSGILSRMSMYSPTTAQERMGITSDVQKSLPNSGQITDQDMVDAIESANNSVNRDIAYGALGTVAGMVAPFGGNVVGLAKNVLADDSMTDQAWSDNLMASVAPNIFQANLDDAVKQDKLSSAVKESMSNNGIINGALNVAQAGTMAGLINGSNTAASIAPALSNPVTNLIGNVADPIVGRELWQNNNADELARLGIDTSPSSNRVANTNNNDSRTSTSSNGILANMAENASANAQSQLPYFQWASGDDFNFNFGMGYKR